MNIYDLQDSQVIIKPSVAIRKIYLELTSECNFDCEMCFRQGFSKSFGSMQQRTLTGALDEIRTLPKLQEVLIGGVGEPLLHPALTAVRIASGQEG